MNIVALIQDCLAQIPLPSTKSSAIEGQSERKLVLAYSGGVDSEVLAYGLGKFARINNHVECLLVHVHHGLSANADNWSEHCLSQAATYGIECKVKHVKVNQAPRLSVEAEARNVRYQALLEELNVNDVLITAHHQDDQLETVLLALKRGLGPKGLAAMGKVQTLKQHYWVARPLLDQSKEQVEAFAAKHNIAHIEDESNFDDKYDRNFLRLAIIPKLKQRWSAIAATASRSAELCAMQQSVLDEEIATKLPLVKQKIANEWVLKLDALAHYSSAWQSLLLRGFMDEQGYAPPSKVQGEQILAQLLHAKDDAQVEIRLADVIIRRFKQNGYFIVPTLAQHKAKQIPPIAFASIEELTSGKFQLPTGEYLSTQLVPLTELGLTALELNSAGETEQPLNCRGLNSAICRLPLESESISIVYALPGSTRCQPHYRSKGRELKKLWQELELPPWKRGCVPLLCYNDTLVAAIGYWVEKAFLVKPATADMDKQQDSDLTATNYGLRIFIN
ncbi:tRNA lysidine(34) synthetase TilS [Shewanella pneumatophori]|uniref:tRNA(Ile)-lysidine synthase n=1 Tax=Shewanella pneumatophori TaxID=314092 RepID=A0A9X1ZMY9_9GAMM|nr:tRNA lysidine(34) synthetase TilS [Shewanella pneumatophori]MCL1138621.1 tRNA lysidine(34) synthetase TilS [Shewanella pneumatophori]